MRTRSWTLGIAAVVSLPFLPVSERCAGVIHEVRPAAVAQLAEAPARVTAEALAEALPIIDPQGRLPPLLELRAGNARLAGRPLVLASATEPYLPEKLADLVVVIDPGHHGGAWSEIEKRHTVLAEGPVVREGDLTYATALLLRDRLVAQGARVVVTRGAPPPTSFPEGIAPSYDADEEARLWLGEQGMPQAFASLWPTVITAWLAARARADKLTQEPFELWNRWDLRQRASLSEVAGADLFLSLHYNMVDGHGRNGVMVFVPGNAEAGELETPTRQYLAARQLLSGSLRESVTLGAAVGRALQARMQLPPIAPPAPSSDGKPPSRRALDVGAGVYARNLAVLRRQSVPALLIEGPCMNEPAEYARLTQMVGSREGVAYPERAVQYADAVTAALVATITKSSDRRPGSASAAP